MTLTAAPGETRVELPRSERDDTTSPAMIETRRQAEEQVAAQLAAFAALGPDWDGYHARPIDRVAIRQAVELVLGWVRQGIPVPEVFPIPNGGVQLEWSAGPMELELEIEPAGGAAVFVGDDRQTGERFDGQIPEETGLFSQALARLLAYR